MATSSCPSSSASTPPVQAEAYDWSSNTHNALPKGKASSNQHTDYENLVSVTTTNPFLQVEVLSPPLPLPHWTSQPITPSPHAHSTTRHENNSSGWKVQGLSSSLNTSYDFCSKGKRIGYDGTNQTPSMQLLKPTASSLGHQVSRPSMQSSPKKRTSSNIDSSFNDLQRYVCASGVMDVPFHNEGIDNHTKKLAYTIPYTSPMNPFGKLGKSITPGSGSITSEEEDTGTMIGHSPNNSSVDATLEEGMNNHRGDYSMSRPGLHRRASWSQGSKHQPHRKRGFSGSCRGDNVSICPERLRSFIIDPVASQLLRECAVHDDDDEEHDFDSAPLLSYSTVSADPSVGGEEANPSCHKGSFFRYSSMTDFFRSDPPNRDGNVFVPLQTNEVLSSVNTYPLSPDPLIRSVSDRLLDVKTEDDIKSLARPIPRKFSVSSVACCAPLPRRFDV